MINNEEHHTARETCGRIVCGLHAGGTRKGPIKDMQYWRDYVSATVRRYQKDVEYWEVRVGKTGSPRK